MNKYEDLIIWNKAMELVEGVYTLMKDVTKDEKYGIISQIKRSAVSIPSNISEGAGRNSKKEFIRFLSIANGSTCELQTQLILLVKLNMISKDNIEPLLNLSKEIQRMNFSLQKKLS